MLGFTLLSFLMAASVQAQPAAPLKLERKIELPGVQGRIDHLSIDLKNQRLFLAALGNDADNVRLDPTTGRIWVGYGDGALGAMDVNGTRVGEVRLSAHPESFQIEKSGPRIFVNLPDAKKIAVVDRNKGAVIASWGT